MTVMDGPMELFASYVQMNASALVAAHRPAEVLDVDHLFPDPPERQLMAFGRRVRIYSVPEDRPFFGKIAIVDADPETVATMVAWKRAEDVPPTKVTIEDITGSGHVTQVTLTSDEPVRSLSS